MNEYGDKTMSPMQYSVSRKQQPPSVVKQLVFRKLLYSDFFDLYLYLFQPLLFPAISFSGTMTSLPEPSNTSTQSLIYLFSYFLVITHSPPNEPT